MGINKDDFLLSLLFFFLFLEKMSLIISAVDSIMMSVFNDRP